MEYSSTAFGIRQCIDFLKYSLIASKSSMHMMVNWSSCDGSFFNYCNLTPGKAVSNCLLNKIRGHEYLFDPDNQNSPRIFPAGKQHQKARGVICGFFISILSIDMTKFLAYILAMKTANIGDLKIISVKGSNLLLALVYYFLYPRHPPGTWIFYS